MFSFDIRLSVYTHFCSQYSGMASTKASSKKRIEVGCRVEGNFGEFVPNTDPKKKRRRDVAFATVIEAAGAKSWVIRRDIDGEVKIVSSRSMKVVEDDCGFPLEDSTSLATKETSNDERSNVSVTISFIIYCLTFAFVSDLFRRNSS